MAPLLVIDGDPETFELFIAKNVFTVQEILALLPYTYNLNPAIRSEISQQVIRLAEIQGVADEVTPPSVSAA